MYNFNSIKAYHSPSKKYPKSVMKNFIILCLFFLFNCNSFIYSQLFSNNRDNLVLETKRNLDDKLTLNDSSTSIDLKDVKGTPYAKNSFSQGKIYNKKLETSYSYFLRYNVYNDIIEIKNGNQAFEMKKTSNLYALFNNLEYHFEEFTNDSEEDSQQGYFVLLNNGKDYKLFLKNYKKYNAPKTAETPYNKSHPASFTDSQMFYFKEKDQKLAPVSKRKKQFLRQFPTMSKEIEKYISSQKIDLDSKEDLIQLFDYIEGLSK